LIRALEKTYVINFKTKEDVAQMWVGLSQIRSLLPVQMSQEEEELMRERLWFVFFFFLTNYILHQCILGIWIFINSYDFLLL
jgi:uncharacterized membrane protein